MPERQCPSCGAPARESARFCAGCGTEIPEERRGATGTVISATPVPPPPAPAVDTEPAPAAGASPSSPPPPSVPIPAQAPSGAASAPAPAAAGAAPGASFEVFPWWQFVFFPIASVGLWSLYWFYCTRKQVNALIANGRTDPGVQTFGAVVPIWQCWVARDMWRDINLVATRSGTRGLDSTAYTVMYVVFGYVPIANYLSFIILILFCITQGRFAAAMDACSGGRAPRRRLTPWSVVWAALPLTALVVLIGFSAAAG